MVEPRPKAFAISKKVVWAAYQRVKANKGAAGIDGQSMKEFEQDLKNNLYKLWNRMSSGSYMTPPVMAVEIPKHGGGVRVLGVPTVADRIAQTVAAMYLEPEVEPLFHDDSFGYRPGRSAKQALGRCRERCWRKDWVIDLDIRKFFDTIPHDLLMRAVRKHTQLKWLLLYIERWLRAPLQLEDGTMATRDQGSPQGSAISPLLANLFMHYAFDVWMRKEFPHVSFERYCDDVVIHCASEAQAVYVKSAIRQRLRECRLEMNSEKTRIVYCKDAKRRGSYEHTRFVYLGYEFGVRRARTSSGRFFENFGPAISPEAATAIRHEMRSWHMARHTGRTLVELAEWANPRVQGWINYYGAFYRSALHSIFLPLNDHLARWARRKYKRLGKRRGQSYEFIKRVYRERPTLFAHWRLGVRP